MDYTEILDYLFQQLPFYQRIGKAAYKSGLENTFRLDEYFRHPHRRLPAGGQQVRHAGLGRRGLDEAQLYGPADTRPVCIPLPTCSTFVNA